MKTFYVEAIPLWFKRNLLKNDSHGIYIDKWHPRWSVAGFSLAKEDFDLLKFYQTFTDIEGALLEGETREELPGEKLLGCVDCAMRKAGNRPYLSPRNERHEEQGFADKWAVLCFGLMASSRPSDDRIPCLKLLSNKNPIKLQFEAVEE